MEFNSNSIEVLLDWGELGWKRSWRMNKGNENAIAFILFVFELQCQILQEAKIEMFSIIIFLNRYLMNVQCLDFENTQKSLVLSADKMIDKI